MKGIGRKGGDPGQCSSFHCVVVNVLADGRTQLERVKKVGDRGGGEHQRTVAGEAQYAEQGSFLFLAVRHSEGLVEMGEKPELSLTNLFRGRYDPFSKGRVGKQIRPSTDSAKGSSM